MKFSELRRSLLLRPEYGTIKFREEFDREIWCAAIDSCLEILRSEYVEGHLFAGKYAIGQIEKLKV
jgi:hypothetical protein